jgi:hypothetical protein
VGLGFPQMIHQNDIGIFLKQDNLTAMALDGY